MVIWQWPFSTCRASQALPEPRRLRNHHLHVSMQDGGVGFQEPLENLCNAGQATGLQLQLACRCIPLNFWHEEIDAPMRMQFKPRQFVGLQLHRHANISLCKGKLGVCDQVSSETTAIAGKPQTFSFLPNFPWPRLHLEVILHQSEMTRFLIWSTIDAINYFIEISIN